MISEDPRGRRLFGWIVAPLLVAVMLFFWLRHGGELVWVVLFSLVVAGGLLWSLSRLGAVWIDDRGLYISAGGRERFVPFTELVAVEPVGRRRRRYVALKLRRSEPRWVWFVARGEEDRRRSPLRASRPHPIVEELEARIGGDGRSGAAGSGEPG